MSTFSFSQITLFFSTKAYNSKVRRAYHTSGFQVGSTYESADCKNLNMAACKMFHTNANTDMQIAARHESLPCCINLGNAEAVHCVRFLVQLLKVRVRRLLIGAINYNC